MTVSKKQKLWLVISLFVFIIVLGDKYWTHFYFGKSAVVEQTYPESSLPSTAYDETTPPIIALAPADSTQADSTQAAPITPVPAPADSALIELQKSNLERGKKLIEKYKN